ncbi:MAG: hypothetical protein NW208_12260 [Bryobacter sp.]|nr:hypothetical protein [Bryobacter sp.]
MNPLPIAEPVPETKFQCHICAEPSTEICVYCTKDACELHLCDKCARCTDCCLCHLGSPARY